VEHEELGQDYVLRQDPKPGAEVPPGTEVELTAVAPN
jgi:beta-lactam-binding protein with PASTA domain